MIAKKLSKYKRQRRGKYFNQYKLCMVYFDLTSTIQMYAQQIALYTDWRQLSPWFYYEVMDEIREKSKHQSLVSLRDEKAKLYHDTCKPKEGWEVY
jgi:hypothetical protein